MYVGTHFGTHRFRGWEGLSIQPRLRDRPRQGHLDVGVCLGVLLPQKGDGAACIKILILCLHPKFFIK